MEAPCLDAVAEAIKATFGFQVSFEHTITAECNTTKHFCWQKVLATGPRSPCLFTDVAKLHAGVAPCVNHRPQAAADGPGPAKRRRVAVQQDGEQPGCPVRGCDISVTGSSCKYFSKLNQQQKWGNPLEFLAKQGGGGSHQSWTTYLAWIVFLDKHRPEVVIYENVDSMIDAEADSASAAASPTLAADDKSNLQVILDHLSERGYEVCPILVGSEQFGCIQRRHRVFIVGLRTGSRRWSRLVSHADYDRVFEKFKRFLDTMKLAAPRLSDCLMASCDPYVEKELERRLSIPMQPTSSTQSWTAKHQAFCRHHNLRWPVTPSQKTMQSDWFGTLTPREAATLGLVEKLYGENVVVDVTQDLAFGGRVTDDSRCNTVLPGTTYWVGGDINRVVTGYESLQRLQGWPLQNCPDITAHVDDNTLGDLAGKPICDNVPVSIFSALFLFPLSGSWRPVAARRLREPQFWHLSSVEFSCLGFSAGSCAAALASFLLF